jgi:hypothetical protein
MRISLRSTAPAAVITVAALLLTGCGSDDSSGGNGGNGLGAGGSTEGDGGDGLELETTGGIGEGGDDDEDDGAPKPPSIGNDTSDGNPLQFRWESADTVMVITDDGSLLGDRTLDATCPGNGTSGVLTNSPILFSCSENDINLRSVTVKLDDSGDNLIVEYDADGSTETLAKGEDLRDQQVDLEAMRETLLD